jgi:hypothetical protein
MLQLVSSTKISDVDYTAPTALTDENRWSMFREVASYWGCVNAWPCTEIAWSRIPFFSL